MPAGRSGSVPVGTLVEHQSAPSLPRFLREFPAFFGLRMRTYRLPPSEGDGPLRVAPAPAHRPPVLVVPGFLASDFSTRPFRHALASAGHEVHGWGLGLNRGAQADTLEVLDGILDRIGRDEPAVLIGWSFGGLMARELAKRQPDRVLRVITLGAPFYGNPRANHLWRTYEWVNGYSLDRPPLSVTLHEKPPVETIAIWSRADGIIAPACARGLPDQADRAIEVDCSHVGFMTCPKVLRTVVGLLED